MSLEEKMYSVLIVSSSSTFNQALVDLLSPNHYQPICIVSNINKAKRAFAERNFDFILINSPLPDGNGIHFSIDCNRSITTVVLLFVQSEMQEEIHNKVASHGVYTLAKPTSKGIIIQALGWLASSRERLRNLEKKTLSVEERMLEIRMINRAKILLVSKYHMSESQAHRYIEKQAMDACVSKQKIAEKIIKINEKEKKVNN